MSSEGASSSAGNTVPGNGPTYASAARQSRSVSRGQRGGKRTGQKQDQGEAKRPRQDFPFKTEIWQRKDGKNQPISLEAWRQMDAVLCASAANKVRSQGPPKGGIGVKMWTQHTHPGSEKASTLPPAERYGHAILRFSTMEAQEWYRPLVAEALGPDQDGQLIKLSIDVESDDPRARYTGSILHYEFSTMGESEEERTAFLLKIVLSAINVDTPEESTIFGGRLQETEGKEDLWAASFKFPPLVETALDKILLGQRYNVLATAICPVKFLKQKKAETQEEKLIKATTRMNVQSGANSGRGKSPRSGSSSGDTPPTKVHVSSGSAGNGGPSGSSETAN